MLFTVTHDHQVLVLVSLLAVTVLHQDGGATAYRCPSSFQFLFHVYSSCTPSPYRDSQGNAVPFRHLTQVTGGDVVTEFQRMCSRRIQMSRCIGLNLGRCSAQLRRVHQSAFNKATWFCDQDNNLRGVITHAIIGSQQVPEQEKNKTFCVREAEMERCPVTLLSTPRFSHINGYADLFNPHPHDAARVLNDSIAHEYFHELFDCYFNLVYPKCPHNAIPMVLFGAAHMFSPPKYGVNVSEIILNKAQQIQNGSV